jgi:hypothetical protein
VSAVSAVLPSYAHILSGRGGQELDFCELMNTIRLSRVSTSGTSFGTECMAQSYDFTRKRGSLIDLVSKYTDERYFRCAREDEIGRPGEWGSR